MEVAQCSAKKSLVRNESGSLVVVIAIMGMIAGLIAYWTSLSGKVDKEVRSLSATQSTAYMRADFQNTIKKLLKGEIVNCPITPAMVNAKFEDFSVLTTDAFITRSYTDNPATTNVNEIAMNPDFVKNCFFNISRYSGLAWNKINISIRRTSEPNYITLSNFITADVQAAFKSEGKPIVLKFQLKYRIDVLTINSFGIIFTDSNSGPKVSIDTNSKVKINSSVLFDSSARSDPQPLNNFMELPDTGRLIYSKEVYTSAPTFTSNQDLLDFLNSKTILNVFEKGIEFNQLPKGAFEAPYQKSPLQWNEILDFKPVLDAAYPLPNSTQVAIITDALGIPNFSYNGSINQTNTADIYNNLYGTGSENKLIESCRQMTTDMSTGAYPLYIFNNLTQDFTIDFTHNTDVDHPPVFCGVIAAKNIIIKLNDQDSDGINFLHHFIGKMIIKEKLIVSNKGSLTIHDIMQFSEDSVQYPEPQMNVTNLRTQFYNQKYYSTQNFFLPFFEAGKTPTPSDLMGASNGKFYVPRATKAFFNTCPSPNTSKSCRNPDIPAPVKEDLAQNNWQDLLFEVYVVE